MKMLLHLDKKKLPFPLLLNVIEESKEMVLLVYFMRITKLTLPSNISPLQCLEVLITVWMLSQRQVHMWAACSLPALTSALKHN